MIRYLLVVSLLCFLLSLVVAATPHNGSHHESNDAVPAGPTVAVIGCGPSGMFFLHALAEKRKELEAEGDMEKLSRLPQVTVFEKSSAPGGVWRSDRNRDDSDETDEASTNMYEGLWINSIKEGMEFFDYTYEEHFNAEPQPAYLPRQHVLEYIMARVRKHGDIFEDVQFNTSVTSVHYNEELQKFVINSENKKEGVASLQLFDKCIWAAGENGVPNMIPETVDKLEDFTGQIVHSAAMDKLASPENNAVKGKRIVLIGDSSSAEDLALQSIKMGAEKLYIVARNSHGSASYMGAWPFNRVETLAYSEVSGVKNGNTISFQRTLPYLPDNPDDAENIDIVIFCTGYQEISDFLSYDLIPWTDPEEEDTWSLEDLGIDPNTWEMKENYLTPHIGHVQPAQTIKANSNYVYQYLYRRQFLIDNPNMMFMYQVSTHPLLESDIMARKLLAVIIGDQALPTEKEMIESNRQDIRNSMDVPPLRLIIDSNYRLAENVKLHDSWFKNSTSAAAVNINSELVKSYFVGEISYDNAFLAGEMQEANYPVQFGTIDALDETGMHLTRMSTIEAHTRIELGVSQGIDQPWMTYRDMDPSNFTSILTGMRSSRLKGKWIEIDNEGNLPNSTSATPAESLDSEVQNSVNGLAGACAATQ